MIREKIRPNVWYLGTLLALLTGGAMAGMFFFISAFAPDTPFWDGAVVGALFTLMVSIVVGGVTAIGSVMNGVSQDPPPPSFPAGPTIELVEKVKK